MGALEELVSARKIRYYDCSKYSGTQLQDAFDAAKNAGLKGFVTAQNPWSMLECSIEANLIPACLTNDIGLLPYYPIAQGLLTSKYRRGSVAPAGSRLVGDRPWHHEFRPLRALETYAGDHGYDLLTLAISWLAAQPSIACIIFGASPPAQVAVNANAARWKLSAGKLDEIDALLGA